MKKKSAVTQAAGRTRGASAGRGAAVARDRARSRRARADRRSSSRSLLSAHVGHERVELLGRQRLTERRRHHAGLIPVGDDGIRIDDRLADELRHGLPGLPDLLRIVQRRADLRVGARRRTRDSRRSPPMRTSSGRAPAHRRLRRPRVARPPPARRATSRTPPARARARARASSSGRGRTARCR